MWWKIMIKKKTVVIFLTSWRYMQKIFMQLIAFLLHHKFLIYNMQNCEAEIIQINLQKNMQGRSMA